jgi:hypothetical protein
MATLDDLEHTLTEIKDLLQESKDKEKKARPLPEKLEKTLAKSMGLDKIIADFRKNLGQVFTHQIGGVEIKNPVADVFDKMLEKFQGKVAKIHFPLFTPPEQQKPITEIAKRLPKERPETSAPEPKEHPKTSTTIHTKEPARGKEKLPTPPVPKQETKIDVAGLMSGKTDMGGMMFHQDRPSLVNPAAPPVRSPLPQFAEKLAKTEPQKLDMGGMMFRQAPKVAEGGGEMAAGAAEGGEAAEAAGAAEGGGLARLGAIAGPVGLGIGLLGSIAYKAYESMKNFPEEVAKSGEALKSFVGQFADVSGPMARISAELMRADIEHKQRVGEAVAGTTEELTQAQIKAQKAGEPLEEFKANLGNEAERWWLNIKTGLTETITNPIVDVLNKLFGFKEPKDIPLNDLETEFNKMAQRFADWQRLQKPIRQEPIQQIRKRPRHHK